MAYDSTLTLTIPANLYDIACAISRAMDVDLGGANSWGPRTKYEHESGIEITPDSYTMTTPCTAEFKAQAVQLLQYPDALFDVVSADYATRWPDLTPPTLEDCEAFCAGAVIVEPEVTDGSN
jgi:hypothetical protein